MRKLRDWMERHFPRLVGVWDWPGYRLFSECWADDCPVWNRRMVLHSPRQERRCAGTPMAISLTERGWLFGEGIDPDSVVPVSHAKPA